MNVKKNYKTKQRDLLLAYLQAAHGEHITVNDACAFFHSEGLAIGQTTVYRQLERMVDEGIVNKYIIDANSPACFEYMEEAAHADGGTCFHCKCEQCGKLIHLHCNEIDAIQGHLQEKHRFTLDPRRTVFYGLCESCTERQGEDR